MKFTQDFRADFAEMQRAVAAGERFAFTRFNTGEFGVIQGRKTHARGSGWVYPGGDTEYHRCMKAAWAYGGPNWFVGIACPCCNPPEYQWYSKNMHVMRQRTSYATLFMGSNWPASRDWANDLRKKGWLLVGPRLADITVPENVFEPEEWDFRPTLETMLRLDHSFLLAAGIAAKILAWRYWSHPASPKQTVIDIGSVLDVEMFGRPTRIYLQPRMIGRFQDPAVKARQKRVNSIIGRTCVWKMAKASVHHQAGASK